MESTWHRPVILVTGVSGRIGAALARSLLPRYEVAGADLRAPEPPIDGLDFARCDLTQDDDVRRFLARLRQRGDRLASVVHLAAYYDFSGAPSPLYDELTVGGTRRLLHGLQDFAVEQFVFSSSMLVMRPSPDGRKIDEDSPTEASWEYPRSKLAAEAVIRELHGRIPAVVLRIAGVYDDDCHSIPLAQHIRRIRERRLESYLLPGDPEHGQAYVHLDDLVECIGMGIESRERLGPFETLLIAEPETVSYRELQDRIGLLLHGEEWPTIRIPAAMAKAGAWLKDKLTPGRDSFIKPWMIDFADADYPISIERARTRLGWEPRRRLRDALEPMIEKLRADPARWYATNDLPPPTDV